MFCTHCHVARIENGAPCPNCGVAAPQQGGAAEGNGWAAAGSSWASWSSGQSIQDGTVQQISWQASAQRAWSYDGIAQDAGRQQSYQTSWQQNGLQPAPQPQNEQSAQKQHQSLLPVPYQGGMAPQPGLPVQNTTLQVMSLEQLLPYIPAEEHALYVPPMYTKPRPLIPKYRIISGLISVLIVTILACTGAGYYAHTTGTLAAVQRFITGAPPPPSKTLLAQKVEIPDPPAQKPEDRGPAFNVIPSAGTASRVDEKTYIPLQPEKIFKVNQVIYVTYSIQKPKEPGRVTVKWYMNNVYFTEKSSDIFDPKKDKGKQAANGVAKLSYAEPASGMAEIYWNDQFAQRVYFAVRA